MQRVLRERLTADRVLNAVTLMTQKWSDLNQRKPRKSFDVGRQHGLAEAIAFLVGVPVNDVEAALKAGEL